MDAWVLRLTTVLIVRYATLRCSIGMYLLGTSGRLSSVCHSAASSSIPN